MKRRVELAAEDTRCGYRSRYLLVLALAVVMAFSMGSAPAFAAQASEQPVDSQIVGGTEVTDGKYPFIATLQDIRLGSTGYERHICGGTLIAPGYVLTAAHCVFDYDENNRPTTLTPADQLRVIVGRTVLNSDQGQERAVTSVSVHPRYKKNHIALGHDAAVLRLDSPVEGIEPIRLAAEGSDKLERPGKLATTAGWGNTIKQPPRGGAGVNYPDRMREARVPIVGDKECGKAYDPFVPKLLVCADKPGVSTCQGDSGGPLFHARDGSLRQIGIVSFATGCAAKRFPTAYTEVSAPTITNFIQQAIGGTVASAESAAP